MTKMKGKNIKDPPNPRPKPKPRPKSDYFRGYPVFEKDSRWYYKDTGQLVGPNWKDRPCGHCGKPDTDDGHDGCLGELPGVNNACCGHGKHNEAYIQFKNGVTIRGFETIEKDP